ncbi:MAG: molybdopterin converting factor subunit 1 [Alphaproteobacteria bacterium]
MRIRYFAWLRTKTGVGAEELARPAEVHDVDGLVRWLVARGPGYAEAFHERGAVRCAVNLDYVGFDHPLGDDDEVAFFPPVTGG